ncbi:hypothetical protein DYBT9623_02021 [Dyadobacter sp. CECT 9623]|uniref:DUF3800 domain-containing protein n=1 Tax=Dyadobacter linearis TaxID=2823330 RepID=A0ABN7R5C1_9BACT|nr:hypothetical protein DYBT9623_02021 [Dyadobacter sp. CECT 9623]
MDFTLYLDESGDHGLNRIDPSFPVFVLCGVLFHEKGYALFNEQFNTLKVHFFNSNELIFHSREIRKCEKEFRILADERTKLIKKQKSLTGYLLNSFADRVTPIPRRI